MKVYISSANDSWISKLIEEYKNQPMPNRTKYIKVTHNFYNYLTAQHKENVYYTNENYGLLTHLTGIPVKIDDTIDNPYYEFAYESEG